MKKTHGALRAKLSGKEARHRWEARGQALPPTICDATSDFLLQDRCLMFGSGSGRGRVPIRESKRFSVHRWDWRHSQTELTVKDCFDFAGLADEVAGRGMRNSTLADDIGFAYLCGMQREQKSPRRVAKLFLAGLLAVLLLAFGVTVASASLHHSIHHDSAENANACVICSLAQGHVDVADPSPTLAATVLLPLCGLLAASAGVPWSFNFLLPPGRAPPRFSHSV
jgi:hypothetical protein